MHDLRVAHPDFRYPSLRQGEWKGEDREALLFRLLWKTQIGGSHLFSNSQLAFEFWIQKNNIKKIVLPTPYAPIFRSLDIESHFISRDPEELLRMNFSNFDALAFSNPSLADGFYYPQDLFEDLITKILHKYPRIKILSEESQSLFCFNEVTPGSLRPLLEEYNQCTLLQSIYPLMNPQGPYVAWLSGRDFQNLIEKNLSDHELENTFASLSTFRAKQGSTLQAFQDKMIIQNRALRNFVDHLRPSIEAEKIKIPFWPEAGFYLSLDISSQLVKSGLSLEKWVLEASQNWGIIFYPGSLYGAPQCVRISYAAPYKYLENLAKTLNEKLL